MLQTHGKFREWQNTSCVLFKRQASTSRNSKPSPQSWGAIGNPMTEQAASVFEEPRKALAKCPWLKRSLPASPSLPYPGLSLGHPAGQKCIRTGCLSISGLQWAQYLCSPFCTCKLKRNKINKKVWPAGFWTRLWWADTMKYVHLKRIQLFIWKISHTKGGFHVHCFLPL